MRRVLEGFVNDPPDTEYQEGFLAAVAVIAVDVMGMEWDDPLLQKVDRLVDDATPQAHATIAKLRPALTVISGGKEPQ